MVRLERDGLSMQQAKLGSGGRPRALDAREPDRGLVEVVPIYTDDDRLIEKIAEVADPDDDQVWQATLATEAGTVEAFGRWIDGRDDAIVKALAAWTAPGATAGRAGRPIVVWGHDGELGHDDVLRG